MSLALKAFKHNVNARLESLQWDRVTLAKRLQIHRQAVTRYLDPKDDTEPRLDTVEAFAKALGVPIGRLLSDGDMDHDILECSRRVSEAVRKSTR